MGRRQWKRKGSQATRSCTIDLEHRVFRLSINGYCFWLLLPVRVLTFSFLLRFETIQHFRSSVCRFLNELLFEAVIKWTFHRIHQRQHATDNAGMSKHRLSPYYAFYHNWHTSNFTASDSSSDERCFLKVLIVTQLAGSIFQLSVALFLKNIFPSIQSKSFLKRLLVISLSTTFI